MEAGTVVLLLTFLFPSLGYSQSGEDREAEARASLLIRELFQVNGRVQVYKDIEISDQQIQRVREISSGYSKSALELSEKQQRRRFESRETEDSDARKPSKLEVMEWKSLGDATLAKLEEVFLKHQFERLKQRANFGLLLRRHANDKFEAMIAISNQLNLSKKDRDKYIDTIKKEKEDYVKRLESLNRRTERAIRNSLPDSAQKELEKLLGSEIF